MPKVSGQWIQAVMNEYKTRDLFDHGFESTKYAASIFELLRNSIASPKKAEEWMLIDILFSISNPYKKREFLTMYIDNYNHIFSEVLYSIFIHNIYPNCFPTTSPLYNIQTTIANPFAYLALLCDSLQKWNRSQSIFSPLLEIRPSKHASNQYNIIVKSDGIYLYEEDDEKSQARLARDIEGMTHLKDVKAIIKNGYVNRET